MENMIEALNKADLWYALRQLARQVPHWKTKVNLSAFNSTFETFFIADSIKVALGIGNWRLGIGHLGIPNNATICRSDQQTIASYCPIPNAQSNLYWISYIHRLFLVWLVWVEPCVKRQHQRKLPYYVILPLWTIAEPASPHVVKCTVRFLVTAPSPLLPPHSVRLCLKSSFIF